MALDTKYRPTSYADVLGQQDSVAVLKQFVKEGRGFHQSYVFCGQHGSGKTTLGRILARALLCENPKEGEPCDECPSCNTLLAGKVSESFEELDAATKSGKADVLRITDDIGYSTFSGKRRIYLFDESHRLSKQALDALLKPMEDCVPGAEEKQLVCIFCTTEPEKMRATIFSRCAPAFVIKTVPPEKIAVRLAHVCDREGIEWEQDALVMVAEAAECHIRDALKTIEAVSLLSAVTQEAVVSYLRLGVNDKAITLLEQIGVDLPAAIEGVHEIAIEVSPSVAYERISEAALCAYRHHLGVGKIPRMWKQEGIEVLSQRGEVLLTLASRFASPPHRPTAQTLVLDVGLQHHLISRGVSTAVPNAIILPLAPSSVPLTPLKNTSPAPSMGIEEKIVLPSPSMGKVLEVNGTGTVGTAKSGVSGARTTDTGVWVDPRAIGKGSYHRRTRSSDTSSPLSPAHPTNDMLTPDVFKVVVAAHLRRLSNGSSGREG